jgi:hypothetical protein
MNSSNVCFAGLDPDKHMAFETLHSNSPSPDADLPPSKLSRGNPPPGMRIGDRGAMGRILVAGEPGNAIVEEVAPIEVRVLRRGRPLQLRQR